MMQACYYHMIMAVTKPRSGSPLSSRELGEFLRSRRDRLSPEVAEMVYYGFWFVPKMDALMAFMREVEKPVTGEVTLGFYKGNVMVQSRTSPNSLYDAAIASMEGGGSYDQTDAEGFLRIQGLPSRVMGKVRPRAY